MALYKDIRRRPYWNIEVSHETLTFPELTFIILRYFALYKSNYCVNCPQLIHYLRGPSYRRGNPGTAGRPPIPARQRPPSRLDRAPRRADTRAGGGERRQPL